jgi:hypothetical protein
MTWDQIVANDKLLNASFFIVGKDPMVPAIHLIIPWTPAVVREPILMPAVLDKFAQSCRLHNHPTYRFVPFREFVIENELRVVAVSVRVPMASRLKTRFLDPGEISGSIFARAEADSRQK